MIEKKDKEAGYIELGHPEGVPDVKSITEKELDEKLREPVLNHNRQIQSEVILFLHIIQENSVDMNPTYLFKKRKNRRP